MMMRTLLLALLLAAPLSAQDDPYHTWVKTYLSTNHGISGGAWTIGSTEAQAINPNESGVTVSQVNSQPAGTPITAYLSANPVNPDPGSPWNSALRWPNLSGSSQGDRHLLVAWIRGSASDDAPIIRLRYEESSSPYASGLSFVGSVNDEWELILFPFEAPKAHPVGQAAVQLAIGFKQQTIEVGGMAVLNYGTSYELSELPLKVPAFTYEGREQNHPWRQAALDRIEDIRKADMTVNVIDAGGNPVPNAQVNVEMTSNAFGFGSFDDGPYSILEGDDADKYRLEFERLFNYATVGIYWSSYNPTRVNQQIDWFESKGIGVRAHPIIWSRPFISGWSPLPPDVRDSTDPAYIRNRIIQRQDQVNADIGARLTDIDVMNEPRTSAKLEPIIGYGARNEWFVQARERNASMGLFINEYDILSRFGEGIDSHNTYKNDIQSLLDAGAPVTGIGFQMHVGSAPTTPMRMLELLDDFGAYGLDLKITEFDMERMPDDIGADYLRDVLIASYSHPSMTSFTMWGFWDGSHWLDDGPLFKRDWTPKPAVAEWERLVLNDWWTRESGSTSGSGAFTAEGHHGEYQITVTVDGTEYVQTARLDESGSTVTVTIGSINAFILDARVMLQGPFDDALGRMDATASFVAAVPESDPYGGSETLNPDLRDASGELALIDWVMVEIRDAADSSIVRGSRPALLRADGSVIAATGGPVTIPGLSDGSYHVVVRHRNHLAVITPSPVGLAKGLTTTVDFVSGG